MLMSTNVTVTGPGIEWNGATFDFFGGTTNTRWINQANTTVLMSLADSGGLTVNTLAPATPVAKTLYEDSIIKGWVRFNAAGTIADDVNVSSITDNGVGNWTVNWATAFASANYAVTMLVGSDSQVNNRVMAIVSIGVSSIQIVSANNDATASVVASDPTGVDGVFVMAIGNN